MKTINYITTENYIEKIKHYQKYNVYSSAFDFNYDNINFINKLLSSLFSDNDVKYTSETFEDAMRNFNVKLNAEIFFNDNKLTHKSNYIIFFIGRGWNYNQAKEKILQTTLKKPIFFNKDEIIEYFTTNNIFSINLNNKEFIAKLLNLIRIPYGNINISILTKQLNNYFNSQYPPLNNKKNRGYITNTINFWTVRGYSEDEAKKIIYENTQKKSYLSLEYYKNKGIDEDEAKNIISNIQSKNAKLSKCNKSYWIKLGLNEVEAIEKALEYARLSSVWSKQHWMNLGYNEEDAHKKCLEYNASSKLCKKYNGDIKKFYDHLLNASISKQEQFVQHRSDLNNEKDNDKKVKMLKIGYGYISKSENKCFEILKEINPNIQHKPYIVSFPENFISVQNKICYICDGYLKYNNLYIIIEYDGGMGKFHDEDIDKIKSEEILLVDELVLGIIRIQETLFKNYNRLLTEGGLEGIFSKALDDIIKCKQSIIILK